MKEDGLERICFNCNHYFPESSGEPTEFGICLNDEAFDPFIDELLENLNYAVCQDLIDRKKFLGQREACEDFEESEIVEIDDDSPLGSELKRLSKTGELNLESLEQALLEERVRSIDWKSAPVDQYVNRLRDPRPEEQDAAISSLGGLIALGNVEAFEGLFDFFKELPPPETIEEVHFKIRILGQLERPDTKVRLIPYLIDELYRMPSNNTTRQWISRILQFLEYSPREEIRGPLVKMLSERRFSYKFKRRIESILFK